MPSREGSQVPDIALAELKDGSVQKIRGSELFAGKRMVGL